MILNRLRNLFFTTCLFFLVAVKALGSSSSDHFRTTKSGNYNDLTVWQSSPDKINWFSATLIPSAPASSITINSGHLVNVSANQNFDDVTIQAGGHLNVNPGVTATIFNGPSAQDFIVNGILSNQGTINASGVLSVKSGGMYRHAHSTTTGQIPYATWEDGSICEIAGFTNTSGSLVGSNQSFYDFVWNCPNQVLGSIPSAGFNNTTIRNNFRVLSTGNGSFRFTTTNSSANLNGNNYYQSGGNVVLINSPDGSLSSILNLSGNFTIEGGTLQKGTGDGKGFIVFSGTRQQIFTKNGGSLSGKIDVIVNSGSTINFGTSILNGSTGSFNLNSNATLITANSAGITTSGTTGSIQNSGTRNYNTGASYNYNGASSQNTGNGLPSIVRKLLINNIAGVTLRSGSITVTDSLNINTGSLNLGTNQLVSNNGGIGAGTLFTQNTSLTPISTGKNWTCTVAYNGASSQTIVSGNYTNLNGTGGARILGANVGISDTFTPGNPNLYTITGSTVHFNGAATQNIPTFNYNNLNGTGGSRILDAQIGIAGTFTPGDPNLYTITGSTINFNGAGAQNIPTFNFNNLTCSTSGTKTVTGSTTILNNVSIQDAAVLNANGNLTLLATANKTANIAALSGAADVVGNVNVQSYLYGVPSGAIRGTKSMSSPINDAAVAGAKTFEQLKNYIIITGPGGAANGFDPGATHQPYAVTLNFYNEAASPTVTSFTPVPTLATATTPGTGFLTFFRGDRTNINTNPNGKLYATFLPAEDVLVTYTGPINKGDITINVGYTNYGDAYDGFYLAGNPYPATIDWDAVRSASTNMGSSITVVTGGKANATYNAVGGVSANGGSRYIQPGQGFYVQANNGGGILRFRENQKNINENPARLLSTPNQPLLALKTNLATGQTNVNKVLASNTTQSVTTSHKTLRMTLKSGDLEEETVVVFDDQFSEEANENDTRYFPGFDVSLATLSSDEKPMAINLMPDIANTSEIKLSISARSSGNMSLSFDELNLGYFNDLWLEDTYLNTMVKIQQGESYNFSLDRTKPQTYGTSRLKILVAPPTTLPVTFKKFEALKVNQGVALRWSTATEINNAGFEVERATDQDKNFIKVGFINALSNASNGASYSFLDENPVQGNNYYRLKQVDKDGKFVYSEIKMLEYGVATNQNQIVLYPNPTTSYIQLSNFSNVKGTISLNIISLNGAFLKKSVFVPGQEIKQDVSSLPNGMYLVEVLSSDGELLSLNKFIKN